MRYAIISDIHGNLPAFNAVLEDIKTQNIDEFIFVGDYYCDLPFPNEVVNIIKGMKNAHVVRGNKEGYLEDLHNRDQKDWVHKQFAALYWNYRELEKDNLNYLMSLPEEELIHIPNGCHILRILHSGTRLFKGTSMDLLSSSQYANRRNEADFTNHDYLEYVSNILSVDNEFLSILKNISANVIIFGHTHIQWHVKMKNKVLINAGSCGLPLDFNTKAAYSILEISGNEIEVSERRVGYNLQDIIAHTSETQLYHNAKGWCEIIFTQLLSAKDEITFFFRHIENIAGKHNNIKQPYSNTVWEEAIKSWKN